MDALFLYFQPLSTLGVTKNLKRFRNITAVRMTIYNCVVKFAPYLIKIAVKKPIAFTNIWHVDEKFIKVRGSKDDFAYLWIVSDSKSSIISTYVSFSRNEISARVVLKKS